MRTDVRFDWRRVLRIRNKLVYLKTVRPKDPDELVVNPVDRVNRGAHVLAAMREKACRLPVLDVEDLEAAERCERHHQCRTTSDSREEDASLHPELEHLLKGVDVEHSHSVVRNNTQEFARRIGKSQRNKREPLLRRPKH
jgi:hypothetical protein